jgi:hypothetical protein
MRIHLASIVLSVLIAAPALPAGGTTDVAKELVQTLSSRQSTAIAAKDPDVPGHYIAALSIPDVQLLVVAAAYSDSAVMDDAIARKDFQVVYGALQGPVNRDGKVFFQDMGADGLRLDGDGTMDVMYENGTEQTLFDGGRKAKEKFGKAETTYERLLKVLLAQAKSLP